MSETVVVFFCVVAWLLMGSFAVGVLGNITEKPPLLSVFVGVLMGPVLLGLVLGGVWVGKLTRTTK
jgi:hypothetical protein